MDPKGTQADHPAADPAPPVRLIWPLAWWPAEDRMLWQRARQGQGPDGRDNPAAGWRARTAAKYADGYGRYLSPGWPGPACCWRRRADRRASPRSGLPTTRSCSRRASRR